MTAASRKHLGVFQIILNSKPGYQTDHILQQHKTKGNIQAESTGKRRKQHKKQEKRRRKAKRKARGDKNEMV